VARPSGARREAALPTPAILLDTARGEGGRHGRRSRAADGAADPRLEPPRAAPPQGLRRADRRGAGRGSASSVRVLVAHPAAPVPRGPPRPARAGGSRAAGGPAPVPRPPGRRARRPGGGVLPSAVSRRPPPPRPVVVLADISGSMQRYTRLLLLFMRALAGAS